jgi:alanine dehydrogenase
MEGRFIISASVFTKELYPMIIGIPKELPLSKVSEEMRVPLTPRGARELIDQGAEVVVESQAGARAGFTDEKYRDMGANVVYAKEEVYGRSDVVVKIHYPQPEEIQYLREGQVLMGFLFLPIAKKDLISELIHRKITAIGYESIQRTDGSEPLLRAMSQIAGCMCPQIAGRLLNTTAHGGRGIILGSIPGIPPADVVIVGAGNLGFFAAKAFAGVGTSVYVMDRDRSRLEHVENMLSGRVITIVYNRHNLEKFVKFADVVVCAVMDPGKRSPILITKDMVKSMKKGAAIIDLSIDTGGCCETSRPIPGFESVYTYEGVLHFSVPNIPSWVPRTASHALSNILVPYIRDFVIHGVSKAIAMNQEIQRGVFTHDGNATHPLLESSGFPCKAFDVRTTEDES